MTQKVNRRCSGGLAALALTVMVLPCWAAENNPVQVKTDMNIVIGTREARVGRDVSVPVTLQDNGQRPSAITMSVHFDSTKLAFVSAEEGPSAIAAGRNVVTLLLSSDTLKVVIAGYTDDPMLDGVLFNMVFHVREFTPLGTIALTSPTTSLSAVTHAGLPIGVSRTNGAVEVVCNGPASPNPLAGALDEQTGVTLTWSTVDGASGYQVYRSDADDVTTSEAISDWLPSTTEQFVDTSFLANIEGYCRLYYWVRARNADECPGDPSEPVDFVINPIPAAPTGLTASEGNSDGILLLWDATANATEYRVYRSTSSDPATRQPLTGWLPATYSYIDATTAAAQYGIVAGCSGKPILDVFTYTYWVTARSANGCESDVSVSAQGYRGPSVSLESATVLPSEAGDVLLWLAAGALLILYRFARKAMAA